MRATALSGCHPGKGIGDDPVALLGGVLVADGGVRAGVAHSRHELSGGGAGGGRPSVAGVAEVVQMQVLAPGEGSRPGPMLLEDVRAERPAALAGEDEVVGRGSDVALEMGGEVGEEVSGDGNDPPSAAVLGSFMTSVPSLSCWRLRTTWTLARSRSMSQRRRAHSSPFRR